MNISRIWENACFKALSKEARQIPQSSAHGLCRREIRRQPPKIPPWGGSSCLLRAAGTVCTLLAQRGASQSPIPLPRPLGPRCSGQGIGQLVVTGRHSCKSVTKVYLQTPTKRVTDMSRVVLNRDEVTWHQLDPVGKGMIHSQRHGAAEIPVSVGGRPSQWDQQRPVLLRLGSVRTQVFKKNLQLVTVPSR